MANIERLLNQYSSGVTSPLQETERLLQNSCAHKYLNCFIYQDKHAVLAQARQADKQWGHSNPKLPLSGIGVAIKDLLDVAGVPTTMGSEQYMHAQAATVDADLVTRLKHSGAIILGKTNTHEFAYGSTGDRSFAGAVLNPHNNKYISGGSSSGSAAALAADLCHAAIGTDTSASIRLPAALCGVVGMKPTYDLLSRKGVFALSPTLDHVGPMTVSVEDNALLLAILADKPKDYYSNLIGQPLAGQKVGILQGFYNEYISASVRAAFQQAGKVLAAHGAILQAVDIPEVKKVYECQQLILAYEAYAQHKQAIERGLQFQQEVKERLLGGKHIQQYQYEQALSYRNTAIGVFDKALAQVDILISPTCGITAPLLNERSTMLAGQSYFTPWLLTRLTAPTNFSTHPSLSVPFGQGDNSLPIGIQLIGRRFEESVLYKYASVLEQNN